MDAVLDGALDDRRRLVAPVGDPGDVDALVRDEFVGVLVHCRSCNEVGDVLPLRGYLVGPVVHGDDVVHVDAATGLTHRGDRGVEFARDGEVRVAVVVVDTDVADIHTHTTQ